MNEMAAHESSPVVPNVAAHRKEAGGRFFAAQQYQSALESYQASLDALAPKLVWASHERFVLTLHSNMALCLLKLDRPKEAILHCQQAEKLPVFQVQAPQKLREKVWARHVQALLESKKVGNVVSDEEIWSVLDKAWRYGCLSSQSSWEIRRTFLQLGARTMNPDSTDTGVEAWMEHLVRSKVLTRKKCKIASKEYQKQAAVILEKENNYQDDPAVHERLERLGLDHLGRFLPKPNATVGLVCRQVLSRVVHGVDPVEAVDFLQTILEQGGLHAFQVDADGTGYFLWAICLGLMSSPAGDGPVEVFLALLSLLVDEYGVSVDQRGRAGGNESRNPLQYVVKSGQPRAVRAMLERGANVNLCDDSGWTALSAVCMNSVKTPDEGGPSVSDRVETARLLLESGAEVDATSLKGFSPLLALCTKPCAPLMKLLLSHGADPNQVSRNLGFTPRGLIQKMDKQSRDAAECLRLLRSSGTDLFDEEETKAEKLDELLKDLVASSNQFGDSCTLFTSTAEGLRQRANQELHVLETLLGILGMDSSVLRRRMTASDGNWLQELHKRVNARVPDCYLRVYRGVLPNKKETALMLSHCQQAVEAGTGKTDEGITFFIEKAAHSKMFEKWRDRGIIYGASMTNFIECVIDPIQHSIGFAVPSDAVLRRIGELGPVVEVGAGTGYFSSILQANGADAVAYDLSPLTEDHEANGFFSHTYTEILQGDAKSLFTLNPSLGSRNLLIVWPNNPDREDSHLYEGEPLPPVWDADCLEDYLEVGGTTVIYVGEREDTINVIQGAPRDCGTSSSRRFQRILKKEFDLLEQHTIPQWFKCKDDLTIWQRK